MSTTHLSYVLADCDGCRHRHGGATDRYRCECGCTQYQQPSQPPDIRDRIEAEARAFRVHARERAR